MLSRFVSTAAAVVALALFSFTSGCDAPAPSAGPVELPEVPSKFVDYGGVKVHWKTHGSGEPALLYVPGWGSDHTVWSEQAKLPPADRRSIYVDLPGHGESDAPERDYSFSWLATAMDVVRAEAGSDEVILVAHSNGAAVARQYLRQYPDKVKGFISVEGSLRPLMSNPQMWDRLVARVRADEYREFVKQMLAGETDEARRQQLYDMTVKTPQHVLVATMDAFGDPRVWQEDTIPVPLLVANAKSRFWTADYRTFVEGLAPDLTWHEREGATHFLMMGEPEWFASTVRGFLEEKQL